MSQEPAPFEPGQLWQAVVETSASALACGALRPIATHQAEVEDSGMRFAVRIAANLERKAEDARRQRQHTAETGRHPNPFLPPEPPLTVAAVGPRHVAVLNKFNVVEHHLLIVTRQFEAQERLLDRTDFAALWTCLGEYDGLGFYNGGTLAGASQPHRHLQLIPLPLVAGGPPLPVEPLLEGMDGEQVPALPFRHRFARLALAGEAEPARWLHARYLGMLEALGIAPREAADGAWQSAPYNLLLTRRWMMLVPRTCEHFERISINAMGFAGSLFVRDEAELERVRAVGPMTLLREVS